MGHLRATVGHLRISKGPLRVILGHLNSGMVKVTLALGIRVSLDRHRITIFLLLLFSFL